MPLRRRHLMLAGLAGAFIAREPLAQQRASLRDPLRLGVDLALFESGLAGALQRGFGRDTGVAVQVVPGPATAVLGALERGELDASLTNTPEVELKLVDQGLAHDRRAVARCSYVLVGPAARGRTPDPAGVDGGRDIALALQQLRQAAAGTTIRFITAGDGSGTHLAEQAAWRAAGLAPEAPWYVRAEAGRALAAQARAQSAYAIVERGAWADLGGAPLAVLVEADPRLDGDVHYMRSFRLSHPAGKMFGQWIAGRRGARVVAAQRGYRAAPR